MPVKLLENKLQTTVFQADSAAHIRVDPARCRECPHRICTRACPAACYRLEHGELRFSHDGCLECGTCRLVCDRQAIAWSYPAGGRGVIYRL